MVDTVDTIKDMYKSNIQSIGIDQFHLSRWAKILALALPRELLGLDVAAAIRLGVLRPIV